MKEEKVLVFADGKAAIDAKAAGAAIVGGGELIDDVSWFDSIHCLLLSHASFVGSLRCNYAYESLVHASLTSHHHTKTRSIFRSQGIDASSQKGNSDGEHCQRDQGSSGHHELEE